MITIVAAFCLAMLLVCINQNASALSSDISRAYSTSEDIVAGSLVSLDSAKQGYVVASNSKKTGFQLIGVAVGNKGSLLAINTQDGNIQVAVSGMANALVSTLNGDIKNGDLIAESAISGVGAKAMPGDRVIGIAQKDFNEKSEGVNSQKVTNINGVNKDIVVGYNPLLIAIGFMPGGGGNLSGISKTVQQWVSSVAGRSVSLARIILCGVIAMIAITSLATMVYSSIRNSLSAVSRNPLAKPIIFEALAQVMAMVALVSIISITTMYAVLRI